MRTFIKGVFFLFLTQLSQAQGNFLEQELSINPFIDGTLTVPENVENPPLVIFIQGSGPTDRNGNQNMMKNDATKKLAHQLAENGIASYRFDKRIFKMRTFNIKEEDLRLEDFVKDVEAILDHFKTKDNFGKIFVAGHSEGSLIGALAAQDKADAFISLAGAGRGIDEIIVEQLSKQSAELSENARLAFEEISKKGSTTNYSPFLESIFRPSVQPYIASWMKYNPAGEISKLDMPVLIVNGTFDIQVDVKDAELLKEAKPEAELVIIQDMNHVFREIKGDKLENTKAYNEPNRPLHPRLIPELVEFIKSV